MVGVPGRSKGCGTCRKRRVKCDESKPVCERCKKGGFACQGYCRERLWRNTSTIPLHDTTQDSRVTVWSSTSIVPALGRMVSHPPPNELSLIAFRDNMCFTYMFENHVWRASGSFFEQAARGKLGSLSLNATSALSMTNFGRSMYERNIEQQGIVLHGRCLAILAQRVALINQPKPELVPTIVIMLMYAGSQSDTPAAISHLHGLARLLVVCGPEGFQQPTLLNSLESARAILTISSLIGRRRLFLEEEKWRTIPWALITNAKSPQSEVMDILIMVPGILQDFHAAPASHGIAFEGVEEVKRLLTLLYTWRWQWPSATEISIEINLDSAYRDRNVQQGRLKFRRFVTASEILLYNTTLMWLLGLLYRMDFARAEAHVETCAREAEPQSNGRKDLEASFHLLNRPGSTVTLREPAIEICRVYEWVSHNHQHSREPTLMYLFPIGMAMTALRSEPVYMDWIKDMLNTSPVTAQYAMGENHTGFGFYLRSTNHLETYGGLQST